MPKIVAISQSNYIPWKGYFDIIAKADEFIIYDEAQFTKNDWRNRNKIKTPSGPQWLTIPVHGSTQKKINEVKVAQSDWNKSHLKTLHQFYKESSHYSVYSDWLKNVFKKVEFEFLSDINRFFIKEINQFLGITTPVLESKDFEFDGDPTEKVISICKQSNADVYLSGPAAKNYLDLSKFDIAGITVEWMDYTSYREYPQLYGPFNHHVTILDLLFNTGNQAKNYLNHTHA